MEERDRLSNAASLLLKGEYAASTEELVKNQQSSEALYCLSLIYRLQDQYDRENRIVNRALQISPDSSYFRKRKRWHELPLFQKMVPRPAAEEAPDPRLDPSQKALDRLCFVTFGSREVFESIVQTIESVKAIPTYRDIPYFLIEAWNHEFTESQKHILHKKYNIHGFVRPDFCKLFPGRADCRRLEGRRPYDQANLTMPFISELVSGFSYYIFIESDIWIKHRIVIDRIVRHTVKHGMVRDHYHVGLMGFKKNARIIKKWQKYFRKFVETDNYINPVEKRDPIYREYYKLIKKGGDPRICQEILIHIMYRNRGLPYLGTDGKEDDNYHLYWVGFPLYSPEKDLVHAKYPRFRINAFHLSSIPIRDRLYYIPVPKVDNLRLSYEEHLAVSQDFLKKGIFDNLPPEYDTWVPIKYRVWPWRDKPFLKEQLTKAAKDMLGPSEKCMK